MAEAERWRQAHPGHQRRRWHLPQIELSKRLDRLVAWVEELLSRPTEPREQCC